MGASRAEDILAIEIYRHAEESAEEITLGPTQVDAGPRMVRGAARSAKVQEITPHDLRHTCASLAVSAGVNVLAPQRMLGHASAKR